MHFAFVEPVTASRSPFATWRFRGSRQDKAIISAIGVELWYDDQGAFGNIEHSFQLAILL
jgi:hypothetical protein